MTDNNLICNDAKIVLDKTISNIQRLLCEAEDSMDTLINKNNEIITDEIRNFLEEYVTQIKNINNIIVRSHKHTGLFKIVLDHIINEFINLNKNFSVMCEDNSEYDGYQVSKISDDVIQLSIETTQNFYGIHIKMEYNMLTELFTFTYYSRWSLTGGGHDGKRRDNFRIPIADIEEVKTICTNTVNSYSDWKYEDEAIEYAITHSPLYTKNPTQKKDLIINSIIKYYYTLFGYSSLEEHINIIENGNILIITGYLYYRENIVIKIKLPIDNEDEFLIESITHTKNISCFNKVHMTDIHEKDKIENCILSGKELHAICRKVWNNSRFDQLGVVIVN